MLAMLSASCVLVSACTKRASSYSTELLGLVLSVQLQTKRFRPGDDRSLTKETNKKPSKATAAMSGSM